MRTLALAFLSLLALSIPCGGAYAETNRKIVVFKDGFSSKPAQSGVIKERGGGSLRPLPLINAFSAVLPPGTQAALLKDGNVARIDDDLIVAASAPKTEKAPEALPWGVDRIDAEWAWGGMEDALAVQSIPAATGEGVDVAILDTGIDLDHPDLAANIKGQVNIIVPNKSGDDDNGHGTHVAGIIAAVDNARGCIGVAPMANLYAVKVLGSNGTGWLSDIINGLDWCIRNGMRVVNMSLGSPTDNASFHQAVAMAHAAGITVCASAGNGGAEGVSYPARYPEVIAVSATDADDTLAYYSSWGPEVDLAAPGTDVYSTYRRGGYKTLSGTSMAAPHVSGAAALLLQKYGPLSPDAVRAHLMYTAEGLGLPAAAQGAGLVDARRACDTPPLQ